MQVCTTKPSMFIAEDSAIADQYREEFEGLFSITLAQTGREAFSLVDEHPRFDIAIVDIIMPVETEERSLEDADTTGLRLIEKLLDDEKCSRFLVITVRWDVDEQLKQLFGTRVPYIILNKGRIEHDEISESVKELMEK